MHICTGRAGKRFMNKNFTMKDFPKEEKPYEKCLACGAGILSDAELLCVILRTGAKGTPALSLAKEILSAVHGEEGILGLHRLTVQDLMRIHGVGKVKAIQIQCILELSRRLAKRRAEDTLHFDEPATVAAYYMEDFRHSDQEQMTLMMLNTRNKLLGEQVISKGTVNASMITPREIYLQALHYHAVSIILIHNHPSGDPTPSRDDAAFTRRVQEAGRMLGIELLDHIVIGDKNYVSFRENGLLEK